MHFTEGSVNRIQKILVATDYSEQARQAEMRAAMLSVELGVASLEMMTVQNTTMGLDTEATVTRSGRITGDDVTRLAERRAHDAAALRDVDGVRFVRSIRVGRPAHAISTRAKETRADITVVAARHRNFLAELFSLDRNEELVRLVEAPLLLVKRDPSSAYRRVVVAVDFSDASLQAARLAMKIAPSGHIILIHAIECQQEGMMRHAGVSDDGIDSYRERTRAARRVKLDAFMQMLGPRRQIISRIIEHGHPAVVVAKCARLSEADLIAVGKHGKSWIAHLLLGSVAQRLAAETACDLLVAPPRDEDDWHDLPAA
jgi:nucleotide-binding universal stress UspA family protein